MPDIASLVSSLGGIAQKRQLVRLGARDLDLTRAVRSGAVFRARQGWYSTLDPASDAVRAVRVGGVLTGISAIRALGGWVLSSPLLHVSVPPNAARLRRASNRHLRLNAKAPGNVALHWDAISVVRRSSPLTVSLEDALIRVIQEETLEVSVACLDWAVSSGRLDRFSLEALVLRLPRRFRFISRWVSFECDSLPESLARTRLRLHGHSVETQRLLPTGERIDLVVDSAAAIEVDGDEFHRLRFDLDRTKDMTITLQGLHALRPTARIVFDDWDRFYDAVRSSLNERGIPPVTQIQDFARIRDPRSARRRARHPVGSRKVLNVQSRRSRE